MSKKEIKDEYLKNGFNSNSNDFSWLVGLSLIESLFNKNSGFQGHYEPNNIETRISKLEAKTEMLEKMLLK